MDGLIIMKLCALLYMIVLLAFVWNSKKIDADTELAANDYQSDYVYTDSESVTSVYSGTTETTKSKEAGFRNETLFPVYIGPGSNNDNIAVQKDYAYAELRDKNMRSDVNSYISDVIGLKRILPDYRPDACKTITYPSNLPPVSVVIIFRDEPIASLLRTVYSVLETSPADLIEEVVLVDDGSTDMFLKLAVDIHVRNVEKLKLVTNKKSLGLMMARQKGIEAATSEYFIVLDGHIEVTPGWLEPLVYRLAKEPKSLLTSHIGLIDRETFNFRVWNAFFAFMTFDQITIAEQWERYSGAFLKARNNSVSPIEYGIVPGMMIAMKKTFFFQLGGFDPGMEIWGSEHMELSTKVWLCGGKVEMVPCSIIGHLYRQPPWQKIYPDGKYLAKNLLRFILVWMDGDIQRLALEALSHAQNVGNVNPGDLEDRLRIRIENKCKPYQYFVDQMLRISNIFIPTNLSRKGLIYNVASHACLDLAERDGHLELLTYACNGFKNQYFVLTNDSIRVDRTWVFAKPNESKPALERHNEDWSNPEYKWKLERNGAIRHIISGKCLTAQETRGNPVFLADCNDSTFQIWEWPKL